jgi:histidine triad (HIT) family protein
MKDCIFCKIVSREVPAHIVYEDELFVGFLDINPQSSGHTLLIPKEHYRWVWDVPESGKYFEAAAKIAKALKKAFGAEAIWSKVMGDEVHHAHIWIFPDPRADTGNKKDFDKNAELIRGLLT